MRYNILVVEDDSKKITAFIEFLGFHNLVITDNVGDAKSHLRSDMFDYIFLDGSLGSTINGHGKEVAKFINENLEYEPEVIIHSWDMIVGEKIQKILPQAKYVAFGTDEFYSIQIGEA